MRGGEEVKTKEEENRCTLKNYKLTALIHNQVLLCVNEVKVCVSDCCC